MRRASLGRLYNLNVILRADQASSHSVAYGEMGCGGNLGFDRLRVSVCGHYYNRAISAHPPSRVTFNVDGEHNLLRCYVALNDTSAEGVHADFLVYADDVLVAVAPRVRRAHHMRCIEANLRGAKKIDLVVEAEPCEFVHALWIDPVLDKEPIVRVESPLGGQYVDAFKALPSGERCIVTVVTPDFVDMASNMLGSLYSNGGVRDAHLVLVAFGESPEVVAMADRFGATLYHAHGHDGETFMLKAMTYASAQLFDASSYLVLDADLLILKSVSSLFDSLDSAPKDALLICKEQGMPSNITLWDGMFGNQHPYYGAVEDSILFGATPHEYGRCPVVNAGVFACNRRAMLGIENLIRDLMPQSADWERMKPDVRWREQGVFNAALARYGNIQEISPVYNVQLAKTTPDIRREAPGATKATHQDEAVKILHFNGEPGKAAYKMFSNDYASVASPVFGHGSLGTDFYRFGHAVFRAAFEPSVCNAFDGEDSFWQLSGMFHAVYKRMDDAPKRMLDVNTFACGLASVLAHFRAKNGGTLWGVRRSPYPPDMLQHLDNHIAGDIEATLLKWKEAGEKFDVITMDTSINIRHLTVCLQISETMLSESGLIYLHDTCNPACEIEAVMQKCKARGLEVAQVARPNKSGSVIFEVKRGVAEA